MNTVILMNDYLFIQSFYDVMSCINIHNGVTEVGKGCQVVVFLLVCCAPHFKVLAYSVFLVYGRRSGDVAARIRAGGKGPAGVQKITR